MEGGNLQPSSNGANDFLSTLSLLGEQLRQFSNSMAQQCHQNSPLQSPSPGFSLGVNVQGQAHAHQNHHHHQHQHSQSLLLSGGNIRSQRNQASNTNFESFFHHLQYEATSVDQQQDYSNLNFSETNLNPPPPHNDMQGVMDHLSMLQNRVQQLRALVPLISQTAHLQTDSHVVAQQQAARAAVVSIISQLAMVAISLLPQQNPLGGSSVITPPSVINLPGTEQSLSQLLQAAVSPPTTNFGDFQMEIGNAFGALGGGTSGGSFGLRSVFGDGGHGFPGMGNEDGVNEQNLRSGEQGGGGSTQAMSLHDQMISNGAGKDLGGGDGKGCGAVKNSSNLLSSLPRSSAQEFFTHDLAGGMQSDPEDGDNDSDRGEDNDSDIDSQFSVLPESFDLVELDATEILAKHTHFCEICGKGFKRDANLRMHMRGHGEQYKTPQALARPGGAQDSPATKRRFSCPYIGCKRNKNHRKFQPLKTMLCVKNHYRRSHCPKVLACQKCKVKKFSVVADLKTHEKHCGRERWVCSCGSTFSRKDKLHGHLGLFAGHVPVVPQDVDGGGGSSTAGGEEQQEALLDESFRSKSKRDAPSFWDS